MHAFLIFSTARSIATLIVVALLAIYLSSQGIAQSVTEVTPAQDESPTQVRTLPPAYDAQMLRLAEILGSLHYLRPLCGADELQTWRDRMRELIDEEQPSAERRAQLIARFNRGFRGLREVYRECTPAAAEAANRYRRQGIRLASEIPERFGN